MELMELCPMEETRRIAELPEAYHAYFPESAVYVRFHS